MNLKATDPHQRLKEWNPTTKFHHIPMWFRMKVREYVRSNGATPDITNEINNLKNELNRSFWDHWCSVKLDGITNRAFVTQPYPHPNNQAIAEYWAGILNCRLLVPTESGVWHAETGLFIFYLPD